MRRVSLLTVALVAGLSFAPRAQGDGGYRLVSNWPTLPSGMYFGLKDAPPPPADGRVPPEAARLRVRDDAAIGRNRSTLHRGFRLYDRAERPLAAATL